jgi:hypothetical protein
VSIDEEINTGAPKRELTAVSLPGRVVGRFRMRQDRDPEGGQASGRHRDVRRPTLGRDDQRPIEPEPEPEPEPDEPGEPLTAAGAEVDHDVRASSSVAHDRREVPRLPGDGLPAVEPGEVPSAERRRERVVDEAVERARVRGQRPASPGRAASR